jgi:signal transduction histidine kinase
MNWKNGRWKKALIAALVLVITGFHYSTGIEHTYLHQIYQRSYYIPILLASFWFEIIGGLVTAGGLTLLYLVHIVHDWAHHPDYSFQQYAEIAMYFVVATLVGYLSRAQRKTGDRLKKTGADLQAAYQRLNETFEELRRSDRLAALGKLAACVAHEIRNPLGSIQGAVEILGQDLPPEEPKAEFARIARQEVARLDKLTGEILQFSRPAPPRQIPIDWREIAESAVRLCADAARRQGVDIAGLADAPSVMIWVDPEQVKQVLINILINAIQAQPGGGRIEIRGAVASGTFALSIRDDGPGIPPEQMDSLFEPFFTTKRTGTGLGLAISYQLVKNNGGEIRVESSEGRGACFHLNLPLHV